MPDWDSASQRAALPADDMVFFHRGLFSAQQSSRRVIIYLNVTDVFVYQKNMKSKLFLSNKVTQTSHVYLHINFE